MFSTSLVVSARERARSRQTWLPEQAMASVLRAGRGRLQLPSRPRAQGAQPPAGARPRAMGRPCQCGVLCHQSWGRAAHDVLSSSYACPRGGHEATSGAALQRLQVLLCNKWREGVL